jgi:hypothetical protein
MPPRLLPLLLITTLAASPAMAATGALKPKPSLILPPAPAADPGLRGPLPSPSPPPPARGLPAPDAALTGLNQAGLSTSPQITSLPVVGDPAPICRAACAETRITCESTGELECDAPWSQCVAGCSDSAATDAGGKG